MSLSDTFASSLLRVNPIEQVEVGLRRCACFLLPIDALAEQIQRRRDAAPIERADGDECLIDRLASDEARRHPLREAIPPNEAEDLLLVREIEQRLSQHEASYASARQ